MKMILIIVDSEQSDEVELILRSPEVSGYTEIPNVLGKGMLGAKMGTRAFPGSSSLYFAAVPKTTCGMLLGKLKEAVDPSQGLKIFSIDTVEEV